MKDYFTKKEQIVILIVVLVAVSYIGFKLVSDNLLQAKKEPLEIVNSDLAQEELEMDHQPPADQSREEEDTIIMIHISGQVHNPGLIELQSGSRVKDAVDLAGGLKKDADIDRINLAKKLLDEEKIYVPEINEEVDIEVISNNLNTPGNSNTAPSSKININSCSKEQLMELPGIGEVTASKIIDYRNKNQFRIIEDIMNVSGIGVKKFEAVEELILVN